MSTLPTLSEMGTRHAKTSDFQILSPSFPSAVVKKHPKGAKALRKVSNSETAHFRERIRRAALTVLLSHKELRHLATIKSKKQSRHDGLLLIWMTRYGLRATGSYLVWLQTPTLRLVPTVHTYHRVSTTYHRVSTTYHTYTTIANLG